MFSTPSSRLRRDLVALILVLLAGLTPLITPSDLALAGTVEAASPHGYWLVAADGGVFAFGKASFHGSTGAIKLNMPIVGMAATPTGKGYWLVASDGGIFAFGDAKFHGSTGAIKLNKPIVGMAATPSGNGYWLVASDGGIFAFGDASFHGSTGDIKLNNPISGMSASVTGRGYRMVASDGGIFSFGDAAFHGSAAGTVHSKTISGMAATPTGKGYWLIGSDGAIFPYGDAASLGSASTLRTPAAMATTPSGAGYWAVGADGSLATFGDAIDFGHPAGVLSRPIVGMAVLASPTTAGSAPSTTSSAPRISPAIGHDPVTTPTAAPVVGQLRKLYSSHAIEGTIGTRPQVLLDPSHPFRKVCDQPPCTEPNANYAEEVRAIALVGNRLFIGGFIHGLLDPSTGSRGTKIHDDINYLVELDATTGKVASDLTFTRNAAPDATVEAITVSPDGQRLYIGGRFTRAGGKPASQIAALDLQTGLMADDFEPPSTRNGSVHAIAAHGNRLYIGGAFKEVNGKSQYSRVAALDAQTGKLIESWIPPKFSGSFVDRQGTPSEGEAAAVNALAVPAGGTYLVVGGEWVHIGTDFPVAYDAYSGLAALNTSDGSIADWRPRNDRPVLGMALSPDDSKICAALGGAGGALTCVQPGDEWPIFDTGKKPQTSDMNAHELLDRRLAHVDGDALGVAVTNNRIYLGGHFDVEEPDPDHKCLHSVPSQCFPPYSTDSTPHRHLVAFTLDGIEDPSWTAQADTAEGPTTMLAGPDALYLGGNFRNTMDKHPGASCWPCTNWGARNPVFHPGFAMFPAVDPR